MSMYCNKKYTILFVQMVPSWICKNIWSKWACWDVIKLAILTKGKNSWAARLSITISCHPPNQITWLFDLCIANVLEIIVMWKFVVKCCVVLLEGGGNSWVHVLAMSRSEGRWCGDTVIRNKERYRALWLLHIRDFSNCDRDFSNRYALQTQQFHSHWHRFCLPVK